MKNRILSAFIAVALALTLIPAFTLTVSAVEMVTIDGIEYSIDNGEATVIGYTGGSSIVIPATITSDAYPVTAIGDGVFSGKTNLTEITIPASVVSIGFSAFNVCSSLERITFAEGSQLRAIGSNVFNNCEHLEQITIPDGVTSIGDWAFDGCSLTSIAIPVSVTTIGDGIFDNCNSLTEIYCVSGSEGETYAEYYYPLIARTLFTFDDSDSYDIPSGRVGTTFNSSTELATTEKSTSTITYTIEPQIDGLSVVDNKLVYTRPATAQAATTAKIKASDGIFSKTIEINIGEVVPISRTISLGTSGIIKGDHIYYGNNGSDMSWRVLDTNGNATGSDDKLNGGAVTNDDALFLVLENALENIEFEPFENIEEASGDWCRKNTDILANTYQGSKAQAWCKDFAGIEGADENIPNAFTPNEFSAILATSKNDSATSGASWGFEATSLSGDNIFFLSAQEASTYFNGTNRVAKDVNGDVVIWWLRSPSARNTSITDQAYVVGNDGNVDISLVHDGHAVRPAFNLNTNNVLFSSVAVDGKADAVDDELSEVETHITDEWKLTLKDSTRSFNVTETALTAAQGETLSISYEGATTYDAVTAPNEYISAIITSGSGTSEQILYYGRLIQPKNEDGTGTVDITIPSDLASGNYNLKVFNEQYNGDGKTDYSSDFVNIPLCVVEPTIISIGTQPTDASVTEGNITGNLTVSATVSNASAPSYQWYACSNAEKANTTDITDATSSSYAIPTAITAGTYYYFCRVSADNAASVDSNVVTVTVTAAPVAPTITTDLLSRGTVGTAYSQTLQATGSTPITWTYETGSSIPGGLVLNSDTGEISGTPTAAGTYDITVKATNTGGEDTKQLSIEIVDAPVTPPTGGSTGGSKSKKYDITNGAGSEWSGEDEGLTITADGEFKNFLRVEVDGNVVNKTNYDAKSGSTIITLKSDYLKTLSVGTHKITIVFKNGTANTTFKITALDELAAGEGIEFTEIPVAVQNGIPFMIISILLTAGMIIYKRKRVK